MEIHNEVKTTDKDFEKKKFVVRNAADIQRAKLEKLMKNPEKPVIIPELPRERDFSSAIPSFVRNVMGSSAGAGSGEFHVYRHLRRKEYARQKHIQEKSRSELMDDEFKMKLEQNKQTSDDRTAKKRAKRLKKKAKQNANRGKKPKKEELSDNSETEEEDDEEVDAESDATEKQKVELETEKAPTNQEVEDKQLECKRDTKDTTEMQGKSKDANNRDVVDKSSVPVVDSESSPSTEKVDETEEITETQNDDASN